MVFVIRGHIVLVDLIRDLFRFDLLSLLVWFSGSFRGFWIALHFFLAEFLCLQFLRFSFVEADKVVLTLRRGFDCGDFGGCGQRLHLGFASRGYIFF